MKTPVFCCLNLLIFLASLANAQTITRCGGPSTTLSTNWSTYHFDVCHTGYNPYENKISISNVGTLTQAWGGFRGATVESSPAVVNGVVYVGSIDGNVYALKAHTGEVLWATKIAPDYIYVVSSPTVVNGVVYIGQDLGDLYALDAKTGVILWSRATPGAIPGSPAVVNGVVYVQSDQLYAFDAATGADVWQYASGEGARWSSPTVVNGVVYLGSHDGNVHAVNAVTGTLLWKFRTSGIVASPAVFDGMVFIGSCSGGSNNVGSVYAFSASTGTLLWQYRTGSCILTSPAIANGVLYIESKDQYLYAFKADTGVLLWQVFVGSVTASSPIVANGIVYTAWWDQPNDPATGIVALDANTGAILWKGLTGLYYQIDSTPAVVDGWLYFGETTGSFGAYHLPNQ